MTEITEAVERATRPIVGMHNRTAQEVFDIMCDRVRFALQAASELTRLREENSRLRLAICGGEDAPGYADSLPLADILGVAANNLGSWREASDRAARLQEEVKGLRGRASELDGELRGLLHGLPELLESGGLTDEEGLIEKAWMTLTRPETEATLATLQGQQS